MRSFLPLTIVFAAMILPALAARDPSPRRGLGKLLVSTVLFTLLYLVYMTRVHPVVFVPQW